jgi:hypothetical protein
LLVDWELGLEKRVVDRVRVRLLDQRDELALELREDLLDLRGRHPLFVVVQEDVVRLPVEAVDVPPLELDVPLEIRKERLEVGALPRLRPHRQRGYRCVRDLPAQLGRHSARLLPVAPGDADEAGVVGIRVEALLVRPQVLEQPPDAVGGEALVADPLQRRDFLGAQRRRAGGHQHLLVPLEEQRGASEVDDLAEPPLQFIELLVHGSPFSRRARRSASRPAMRRPSQIGVRTT